MSKFLWAFLGFLGAASGAFAQGNLAQQVTPGYLTTSGCPSTTPCFIPWNATTPMPVSGTFSATLSGFRPTTTGTPISVTTGGVTRSLPAGSQVVATNVGTTNGAYCKLGASATTSDQYIAPNGGWFGFAISGDTQLTCITGTSTTTVNMTGGTGLPTGTGGGGGSGGGGSVTQGTTPWITAGQGTAGAAAAAVTTIQGIASMTPVQVSQATAASLNATVVGTGTFATQAAQSGTWNITNVSGTVSLPTGASTAANQTSVIGTVAAGTAATNALAVGGIYNSSPITMTNGQGAAHQFDVNGYLAVNVKAATGLAQASTTSGQTGSLVMGATTTSAPAYTDAQTSPLSLTPQGAMRVSITQIGAANIASGGTGGSQGVGGTTATNVAITDNPVNLGAQAVNSENTAVTPARKVQLVADLVGKLIVLPYANPENFVSGVITTAMTGTTSTSLVAAPAAGLRNYLTSCTFSNEHATVGTSIVIQDGSGGTTLWTVPTAPAYGGAQITFPTPLRQPTTATAIFVANVTTGSSTKAACSGYKGA